MKKPINAKYNKLYRDLKKDIEKRYFVLMLIIVISFGVLTINLYAIQITNYEYYVQQLEHYNRKIVEGSATPRGRVYDRHHRLLVDNQAVKTIVYKKEVNVSQNQEIEMAYWVSSMLDLDYEKLSARQLKEFWLINNFQAGNEKITADEWQALSERKLTSQDIHRLKLDRISDDDLAVFSDHDKAAAYIYFLMNEGYWFAEKIIKNQVVSEKEYAIISENLDKLPGFKTKLDWQRVYPYEDAFRSILGRVSNGLPADLQRHYVAKGYRLDDRVGASGIELQFEEYLRGRKNKYQLLNNQLQLLEQGSRGHDIVLTIDIELQMAIEAIIEEELLKAKEERNTEYLDRSFVVVQDSQNGDILAMASKKIVTIDDEHYVYDYTPAIVSDSVVPGSIVKGASHIVAYNEGVLEIGERRLDQCIKIANTPLKCSWTNLGSLNDITALSRSSNTYQYRSAIAIGEGDYQYNRPLAINSDAFSIYRQGFAEFGLGIKTEIDLPNEALGYRGSSLLPGHLLDFSIGQYDTYTPIQLAQYITTIANGGQRLKPQVLKAIYYPSDPDLQFLLKTGTKEILSVVDTKEEYFTRVHEGFRAVMLPGGTGRWHADAKYNLAGKTGTSESFIDTTGDGQVDTLTLSNAFVAYGPYDNPKVSFVVATPSYYHFNNPTRGQSRVNRHISNRVVEKFFSLYE